MCTHLPVHVGNSRTTAFYLTHPFSAGCCPISPLLARNERLFGCVIRGFRGEYTEQNCERKFQGVINIFTFSLPLSLSLCKSLRGINRALSLIEVEYRSKGKMDLDIV